MNLLPNEQELVADKSCKGPSISFHANNSFIGENLFERVVKRWKYLCPDREVGLSLLRTPVQVQVEYRPEKRDAQVRGNRWLEGGSFCTWEPMPTFITAGAIPNICTWKTSFQLAVNVDGRENLSEELVWIQKDYQGWIPIFILGIPHAVASLWMDRFEDRVIAKITELTLLKRLGNTDRKAP